MKYRLHLAVIGLIMIAYVANDATAQRRGFGRLGGRGQNSAMLEQIQAMNTFRVDLIWYVLSLRMDTTDEQVLQLRALAKEASTQKDALLVQARKTEDWNWLREQLEEKEKQFKTDLKGVLPSDVMKTFDKLVEEASQMGRDGAGRFRR